MAHPKKTMLLTAAMIVALLFQACMGNGSPSAAYANGKDDEESSQSGNNVGAAASPDPFGYQSYLAQYASAARPDLNVEADLSKFTSSSDAQAVSMQDDEGRPGTAVKTGEKGSLTWEVNVDREGLYNVGITYLPAEGKGSSMERKFLIDGNVPFTEAGGIVLPRVWANEKDEIDRDSRGNDLRPKQTERPTWQQTYLKDNEGYFSEPYLFYFTPGKHTLTLESVREPMIVGALTLMQEPEAPSYTEMKTQYEAKGYKPAKDILIKVQGEAAAYKSEPVLFPIADRSSPATEPFHVSKFRINTIGGTNWRLPGQWIEWNVEAPEDGLYKIALKERQNAVRGVYSARKVYIDGIVPFKEMEAVPFTYHSDWTMATLGGDEPYLFYLTKGRHSLRLEATLGEVSPMLRQVQDSLFALNEIYRKILIITGSSPDPYRDYQLEKQIPGMLDGLREQADRLEEVSAQLQKLAKGKSEQSAILDKMAYQLEDFYDRPDTIAQRLKDFKTNVGSLGTWILSVREQPLEIDYLVLASPDSKLPKAKASFWSKIKYFFANFFYSFFEDYNVFGGDQGNGKETITIWLDAGRDQAQIMRSLLDTTFTPASGVNVDLKLMSNAVLMNATLAGKAPDVAIAAGNDLPVNFAARGAAHNLAEFPDYEQVAGRFMESSLVPYRYRGGVYALPDQVYFNVLFYRKDILKELNLEVPKTWDDVNQMIPVLQQHHLEFGLPLGMESYAIFLLQNKGSFYLNDGAQSGLSSESAMKAFRTWTNYFTNYKLPLAFELGNRLRTGEMPIGIGYYSFYNFLQVSAPEIRGLWGFANVPGTRDADGTIHSELSGAGTSVVMLESSKRKDAAWQFMKWWTSAETQASYGKEIEGLLGASARYPTANVEALKSLPWPARDYENLESAWSWVRGIPEVPGGYFTARHLDNAFREVINNGTNAREALGDYVEIIDQELLNKRREFNLTE